MEWNEEITPGPCFSPLTFLHLWSFATSLLREKGQVSLQVQVSTGYTKKLEEVSIP
jgi:hypothetical protein